MNFFVRLRPWFRALGGMMLLMGAGVAGSAQEATRSPWAGIYFGSHASGAALPFGTFGLLVRDDGTGVFLPAPGNEGQPALGGRRQFLEVAVNDHGAFELGAAGSAYWFTGQIDAQGSVTIVTQFPREAQPYRQTLIGQRAPTSGGAARFAGYYRGQPTLLVAADGNVFVLLGTEESIGYGGRGTVDAEGNLSAAASFRLTFTGRITADASVATGGSGVFGSNISPFISLNADAPGPRPLVNVSARAQTLAGDPPLILGFVVAGDASADVLARAVGPELARFGIAGANASPELELFRGGTRIDSNNGWSSAANAAQIAMGATASGAFPLTSGSADAAVREPLAPAAYTMVVGGSGVALGEIYALNPANAGTFLVNASARTVVRSGGEAMVGFVISGELPRRVLIRAVGPSLDRLGIAGALMQPELTLFRGTQPLVRGMKADQSSMAVAASVRAGAFALSPRAADEVLLVDLEPGDYTARVTGANGTTGTALIEVYAVP